eukprot:Nk52_evm17s150 gene=Nk52_evmTU17s150
MPPPPQQHQREQQLERVSLSRKLIKVLEHREGFTRAMQKLELEDTKAYVNGKNRAIKEERGGEEEDELWEPTCNVYVRIRPLLPHEVSAGYFPVITALPSTNSFCHTAVAMEPRFDISGGHPKPVRTCYRVDEVFEGGGEEEVYQATGQELVRYAVRGGMCTLLAYGQTGSGKTHTITGILKHAAFDLFPFSGLQQDRNKGHVGAEGISASPSTSSSSSNVYVKIYEIQGKSVNDLLVQPCSGPAAHSDRNANSTTVSGLNAGKAAGAGSILEDKFGRVHAKNVLELRVDSPRHFNQLVQSAFANRSTKATFKNDASSRTHAVCDIRIEQTVGGALSEAEDGHLLVIDLAGSENTADAQFHDRALLKETRLINESLMCLKECIRKRALASNNEIDFESFSGGLETEKSSSGSLQFHHIPFRSSKLTLLLKDAFDLESCRACKTAVIANVSPSVCDFRMSLNTLRYAAPLRIARVKMRRVAGQGDGHFVEDEISTATYEKNPALWRNVRLKQWITETTQGGVNSSVFCPFESGKQIMELPESEFLSRIMLASDGKFGLKRAKVIYTKLWKMLIDARTRERKLKMKKKLYVSAGSTAARDRRERERLETN